jgi:WD40 repeat protein
MSVPPGFWSRRSGLIPVAAILALLVVAPAAGDEPPRGGAPNFDRIHEDLRRAAELRSKAVERWRQGRPAEAIAAAEALIALRPKLGEDRVALGGHLEEVRRFDARRARWPLPLDPNPMEMMRPFAETLQRLSGEEMAVHDLLAVLSEARGDYARASRTWSDLARIRSERLGAGHWVVDEARREADRLDRLAALPPARRRLIERAEGATAVLSLGVPYKIETRFHTPQTPQEVKTVMAAGGPERGMGSAFCIDPRGYFVTAVQVVNQGKQGRSTTHFEREKGALIGLRTTIDQEEWGPMSLVLRAGRPDELALAARVVRVGDDLGLALLKVESPRPLPYLELSRRAPDEGAWACLLGYPIVPREQDSLVMFNRPGEPRSIPVLRGDPTRVGSLHRHQGRPWLIALDTTVPQIASGGLTGGPVLDDEGRVLGMMVEGLAGTDTHHVTPSASLAEFLDREGNRVDVLFDPPPLAFVERKDSTTWTFDVARLAPLPAGTVVEVVFESATAGRRVFAAGPGEGGLFSARVIPVDPREPDPVDVLAPGSADPLQVDDREVSVAGERLRLRDLRRLESRPSPHGYTADGRPFSGPVAGLGTLAGRRGRETARVDAAAAESLTMSYPPVKPEPIPFEIVIRKGDAVLGRHRSVVPIREPRVRLCGPEVLATAGPRGAAATIRPTSKAIGRARIRPPGEVRPDSTPRGLLSIPWAGDQISCVAFAPDGSTYAFGGDGNQIRIVDVARSKVIRSLPQDSRVGGLGFTPDGRTLLAGSYHKRVFFWDVSGGRAAHRLEDGSTPPLTRIVLVPDGRRVLTQHEDEKIRLWDLATGKLERTIASPGRTTLARSPDGRRLLLAGALVPNGSDLLRTSRRTLRLLDLTADRTLWDLALGDGPIATALGFPPDGSSLIAIHSDGTVSWRAPGDGKELRSLKLAAGPRGEVAATSPEGARAITGHDDRTARLWDLSDGRELSRVDLPAAPSGIPAFSPDGRVVALGDRRGYVSLWRLPAPDPPPPGSPGARPDAPVVRRLDGTIAGLAVGGGGRYLLLLFKDRRRIAIFDANAADVVASLPLASDDALIAAGADKAIVVYPALGFLHRYDLASARLEATAAVPVPGRIDIIALGYDSTGPLLATWTPNDETGELCHRWFSLIDPQTLKVIPIDSVQSNPWPIGSVQPQPGVLQVGNFNARRVLFAMRASAGGDLFAVWWPSGQPSGVQTLALRGRSVEMSYQHDSAGSIAPSPDGRTILTETQGVRDVSGKVPAPPRAPTQPSAEVLVPAIGSPFFLGIRGLTPVNNQFRKVSAAIHLTPSGGGPLVITDLDELEEPAAGNPSDPRSVLAPDHRIIWVPAADLLITIPTGRDRLFLRRLDLREALDRLGIDGLFPATPGLLTATAGRPLRSRIGAAARDEKITFALVRGPDGLTVSPDGAIAWEPPARLAGQDVPAVVALEDRSGRRVEFPLTIRVR